MVIKYKSKFVTEVLKTVNIADLFFSKFTKKSRAAGDELIMWRTNHDPLMDFKGQTYSLHVFQPLFHHIIRLYIFFGINIYKYLKTT